MKKNTLFLNATWLAVAVSAYAFGRTHVAPELAGGGTAKGGGAESSTPAGGKNGKRSASAGAEPTSIQLSSAVAEARGGRAGGSGDIASAVEAIRSTRDPIQRNLLFADLLGRLNADNAQEIVDALRSGDRRSRDFGEQLSLVFNAWGRVDGPSAIAYAQGLRAAREAEREAEGRDRGDRGRGRGDFGRGDREGGMAIMSALTGWASADSANAIAWLDGVEDDRAKGFYTMGLINGMVQTDLAAATEYVLNMPPPEPRAEGEGGGEDGRRRGPDPGFMQRRYLSMISSEQIRLGVDNAKAWASSLPDGDMKKSAFNDVAGAFARQDPAEAARWIEGYASEAYAADALREVADEWAERDPKAAVEWSQKLPEETRGRALWETFDEWAQSDPTAASQYLVEMPDSPEKDQAVAGFARELDREDPEAALEWAGSIVDENLRGETVQSVARTWFRADPEAAGAWIQSSGLPAETQQAITAPPERRDFGGRGGPGGDRGGFRGRGGRGR